MSKTNILSEDTTLRYKLETYEDRSFCFALDNDIPYDEYAIYKEWYVEELDVKTIMKDTHKKGYSIIGLLDTKTNTYLTY